MSMTVMPPWKNPVTAATPTASAGRRAVGRPRRHGVGSHVVPVQLDSETGSLGQPIPATRNSGRHVRQAPEEGVAFLVEALNEGMVRHACQEVRRDLRLLMVAQLHPERGRNPC